WVPSFDGDSHGTAIGARIARLRQTGSQATRPLKLATRVLTER
ncbi:MAG: hypothetical protein AVDCRST_MAG15-1613, partial [uncultured Rubellimicrobium sp.]